MSKLLNEVTIFLVNENKKASCLNDIALFKLLLEESDIDYKANCTMRFLREKLGKSEATINQAMDRLEKLEIISIQYSIQNKDKILIFDNHKAASNYIKKKGGKYKNKIFTIAYTRFIN